MVDVPLTLRAARYCPRVFVTPLRPHGRHAGCPVSAHYREDLASTIEPALSGASPLSAVLRVLRVLRPRAPPVKVSETIQRASSLAQALCSTRLGAGTMLSAWSG
jgi:hypothetical protein